MENLKWTSGGGRKVGRVTGISSGEMRETERESLDHLIVLGWRWKSGRGLPQSKTRSVHGRLTDGAKRPGVRQSSGALVGRVKAAGKFEMDKRRRRAQGRARDRNQQR